MGHPLVIQGTWEEIVAREAGRLAGRKVTVLVGTEEPWLVESLDAAIERITNRDAERVSAAREHILSASPRPRELPQGESVFDAVAGRWPGEETDEQVDAALETLS